ncbi:MAG: autotransporter outer membrane beta-barrel domain-containing protein, partial [Planctomycetota bacterium]
MSNKAFSIILIVVTFLLELSLLSTSWGSISVNPALPQNVFGDPGTSQSTVVNVTGTGTGVIDITFTSNPFGIASTIPSPSLPPSGGQLTINTDLTGIPIGTFVNVVINLFQVNPNAQATITLNVEVTAPGKPPRFLPPFSSPPTDEVARLLEAINGGNLSPDLQASIDILSKSSSSDLNQVTSLLSHESARVSNMQELANLTFNPVFGAVASRLFALRGGEKGLNMQGLDFLVGQERLSVGKLTNFLTDGGEEIPSTSVFDKLGIFLNGEIGFGDHDETNREKGFHFNTYEITGGIDYRLTDDIILGTAIGYVRTDIGIDSSGGNPDADGVIFSLYGNYYIKDNFYVDGIVSLGINDFNTSRKIRYTIPDNFNGGTESVNQKMDGDTDAIMKSFSIGSGYDFNYKSLTIGPYGRFTYTRIDIDGYNEHASDPGAPGSEWRLSVGSQDVKSATTAFGCQGAYPISTRW